jgi:hypothetical protein
MYKSLTLLNCSAWQRERLSPVSTTLRSASFISAYAAGQQMNSPASHQGTVPDGAILAPL